MIVLAAFRMASDEPVEVTDTVWAVGTDGNVINASYIDAEAPDLWGSPDGQGHGTVRVLVPEGLLTVVAADWGLYVKQVRVPWDVPGVAL